MAYFFEATLLEPPGSEATVVAGPGDKRINVCRSLCILPVDSDLCSLMHCALRSLLTDQAAWSQSLLFHFRAANDCGCDSGVMLTGLFLNITRIREFKCALSQRAEDWNARNL